MSQEYPITWVGDPREWESGRGDRFLAYEIMLDGVPGKVEWSRKPDSDPPVVGAMTPLATIERGSHGKKLKVDWDAMKDRKSGSSSPPTTSSAGSGNFSAEYARPLRPEVQRAIQRQHSQGRAVDYAALMQSQGRLDVNFGPNDLRTLIDWFEQDIPGSVSS